MTKEQAEKFEKALNEIRKDWKQQNQSLLAIVEKTTSTVTKVESFLSTPFYRDPRFWTAAAPYILIGFLCILTLHHGGCFKIDGVFSIGDKCVPN